MLVIAISIGFGLIPIVSPTFFRIFPDVLKPIFGDGIILTSISAVLLNAFFNRTSPGKPRPTASRLPRRPSTSEAGAGNLYRVTPWNTSGQPRR